MKIVGRLGCIDFVCLGWYIIESPIMQKFVKKD